MERIESLSRHLTAGSLPNPLLGESDRGAKSPYLQHNFGPVGDELYAENLKCIVGVIPSELSGQYLRIGPNPRFDMGSSYHPFDGDGMVHGVQFGSGLCSYQCKWVRTKRFALNEERGGDIPEFGEMNEGEMKNVMNAVDPKTGERYARANTNLIVFGGKLLALDESDKPYAMRLSRSPEHNLETIGREDFGGALLHSCTAHPKVDPRTGEMCLFCYEVSPIAQHRCQYALVDPTRGVISGTPVSLPAAVMMHDFACTDNFSVLFDMNLQFSLERAVEGGGPPWLHDRNAPARFGVMPRRCDRSEGTIRWLDAEPCGCFHFAAAWEECDNETGNTVLVIVGARSNTVLVACDPNNAPGVEETASQ